MTPDISAFRALTLAGRLARREMRTGLKGFRVFLTCLTLGVMAIASVGSLSQSVTAGLRADARFLLGGDVSIHRQHRPIKGERLAYLKSHASQVSSVIEMKAMAQTDNARTLVELKGVDRHYPLVGTVTTLPPGNLQKRLAKQDGVWGAIVESGLLEKLNVHLGDRVRVGQGTFQIRAEINKEPDRVASLLNFGPRFMVSTQALPDTGLIQVGSQIRYYERMALPAGQNISAFIKALNKRFPKAGWRVQGPDNAAPGLQNFINRLTLFLNFAGLASLLVGGIGVLGSVRSYLASKTSTIAILKSLGAPSRLIFQTYLLQILTLSFLGIALGLILGAVIPWLTIELIRDHLPVAPQAGIYPFALLKAAVFGFLVSVTFTLWPLAQARQTPAANLFRTNVMPHIVWPKPYDALAIFAGMLMLGALVVFWAENQRFAYWFILVSVATVFLLRFGALGVMQMAKRIPQPRRAVWRLVLTNLHRPGAATPSIVLALGTGLSVLVAVVLIQGNIARQVQNSIPAQAPAFFFIDIQPHQVEAFDATVTSIAGAGELSRMPSLRGRIVKINGVPTDQVDVAANVRWAVNGDRALTFAATPAPGTVFTDGKWWPEDYAGPPLISFDATVAKGFGVGVGDTLTLNILGRDITATIASLRAIDWRTLRFDFAIIFAPGTLEGAPYTHIAAIKAAPSAEAEIERAVAQGFPNISILRVRDALEAASRIIQGVGAAITSTAGFTVLVGIVVLAGAIAAARAQRVYESVIFKVLGATRRQIMVAFLLEFSLLGLFTGVISVAIGTLISWTVIVHIMAMTWVFLPFEATFTIICAILFTATAGFLGTWRALGEKASLHLRRE